jgi:hypothetical protein
VLRCFAHRALRVVRQAGNRIGIRARGFACLVTEIADLRTPDTRSLALSVTGDKSPCAILRTAVLARRVASRLGGRMPERSRLVPATSNNKPAGCARAAPASRSLKLGVYDL